MLTSKARSLRHTVVATLLIGFALLTAVQYSATAFFVARKVEDIEAIDGFSKLRRLHHAIEHASGDLNRTAADWAIWDDTYRFARGENPAFVADNLMVEAFERLALNFVAIVRDDGTVLYAQVLAPGGRELESAHAELLATAKTLRKESGFLPSRFGPVLMTSQQIQDSDMNEFGHARLFMGRALTALAPGISQITAVPLTIEPVEHIERAQRDQEHTVFKDRDALYAEGAVIHAYSPIDDIAGQPLAFLHAALPRPLQPGLERWLWLLLGVKLLVGAVFGIAALVVVRLRVVRPIERLVTAVAAVGAGASAQRLDENHREHEFIALSRAINTMVSQIEAQQSLRADRDAAVEANRLKSDFLATMSHEIRTPMNGVLGMCELLQRTQLDARQRHLADMLLRSARSLLGILNDILDFSKIESGKLSLESAPFSPQEVINSACAPFVASAQSKGLEFSARCDAAVPALVIGDSLRLRQVLNNLLSNAVKFTKQGSIALTCSVDHCDSKQVTMRIVVRDTGIGIEPEALARIFDAFAQAESSTTRRFGGTGLGLAIVRRLVELMSGEIGVQSEPRRGSSFWFTFKLQRTLMPESLVLGGAIDATGPRFATQHAPRVLLAEDNAVNREVLTEMLEVIGCRVATAENGALALALAAEGSFDAILMDCQMPIMDGHAATMELRAVERASSRARAYIVALTADATEENRQRCLDAGMDAVLTKPISQARLRELILQAVQTHSARNSVAV